MSDIFGYNRQTSPDVVFSNDETMLTIGGVAGKGALVQDWNATYAQQVQDIFEIGSSNIYWVRGHPMGSGSIGRIVGPKDTKFFSEDAYNVCKGGVDFNISMKPGTCEGTAGTGVKLGLKGCVVTQIGFSVNVQDIKINQGIQFRFASMSLD